MSEQNITDRWVDFVTHVATSSIPSAYAQERLFTEGQAFMITGDEWRRGLSHSLLDLGYSLKGSKMKQLKRDYYNPESVEQAKMAINLRTSNEQEVTSVGISTIYGKKRNVQGHCIRSIVLNYFGRKVSPFNQSKVSIDIFYRTTELLRKFGADLIFLREFLLPEILKDTIWSEKLVSKVRFYFSSCFFSALFIPIYYQFRNPEEFLEDLARGRGDVIFYRRCLFRTKAMLERNVDSYKFRSRKNMHELAESIMKKGLVDRKSLEKYIKNKEEFK